MKTSTDTEIQDIPLTSIVVGKRLRQIDDDAVAKLYESAALIGIKTSITVKPRDEHGNYALVTGATRLAVAALLKQKTIQARVDDCSEDEAELWEVSENLHRTELTASQRDEHITKYAELTLKLAGGDRVAAVKKVASTMGLRPTEVDKAQRRNALRQEPKFAEAAKSLGLLNSKQAMDIACEAKNTTGAINKLKEFAKRKQAETVANQQAEKALVKQKWRESVQEVWQAGSKTQREWFLREVVGIPDTVELPL